MIKRMKSDTQCQSLETFFPSSLMFQMKKLELLYLTKFLFEFNVPER
jgi:hypothetical protein